MTKASDNVFPKVIVLEGSAPSSPSAGNQTLYIDSADHRLKRKNSGGTVSVIGGEFASQNGAVTTSQTTTSATFADLATTGPSATVTVGASGAVIVFVRCQMSNSGSNQDFVGVDVSGANTIAAVTYLSTSTQDGTSSVSYASFKVLTGLSTGSTTFKVQYAVGAGTGTFQNREILVMPLS